MPVTFLSLYKFLFLQVRIMINGDLDETNDRLLVNPTRPVFRRGGVDSFLMTVGKPLG